MNTLSGNEVLTDEDLFCLRDIGIKAVKGAEEIVMQYFGQEEIDVSNEKDDVETTSKHYKSPATIADELAERYIKELIRTFFPDHAFVGEEEGVDGESDFVWTIDPIDATKNFMRGRDNRAVLIGLEYRGEMILGISLMPVKGELVVALQGHGCFCNDQECFVSSTELSDALVAHERYKYFRREKLVYSLEKLRSRVRYYEGSKSPYQFHELLQGKIDAIFGPPGLCYYDWAPYKVMVEEAGGKFSTLTGGTFVEGESALASNGVCHEEIIELMKKSKRNTFFSFLSRMVLALHDKLS